MDLTPLLYVSRVMEHSFLLMIQRLLLVIPAISTISMISVISTISVILMISSISCVDLAIVLLLLRGPRAT
jgi:hypothetical protein